MCMKQHLGWGLHEDNTDCQTLCFASVQSRCKCLEENSGCIGSISHQQVATVSQLDYSYSKFQQIPYQLLVMKSI